MQVCLGFVAGTAKHLEIVKLAASAFSYGNDVIYREVVGCTAVGAEPTFASLHAGALAFLLGRIPVAH